MMASDDRVLVSVDGWAGREWYPARLVRVTATRAFVRWSEVAHIGGRGRWVKPGDESWVPRHAVRDEKGGHV